MVRKLPSFSAALLLVAKCKGHLWGETKSPCGGLRRATATRRRHNFLGLFITKVNEFQDFYDMKETDLVELFKIYFMLTVRFAMWIFLRKDSNFLAILLANALAERMLKHREGCFGLDMTSW